MRRKVSRRQRRRPANRPALARPATIP